MDETQRRALAAEHEIDRLRVRTQGADDRAPVAGGVRTEDAVRVVVRSAHEQLELLGTDRGHGHQAASSVVARRVSEASGIANHAGRLRAS